MVDPDATVPSNCSADGAGLVSAIAGEPAHFTILKKDRSGQPRTRGVDHFYADVQGPGKWEGLPLMRMINLRPEPCGSCMQIYICTIPGRHCLTWYS